MKVSYLFIITLLLTAAVFVSCSSDDSTSTPEPSISIIFPDGGDSLGVGASYKITWTDNIEENVNIEIYQGLDENAVRILNYPDVPSSGEYEILVPLDIDPGSDYKVRIVSVLDSAVFDASSTYFGFTKSVADENDNPANAVEVTVPHRKTYAVYPSGDADWYKIKLNLNQKYLFSNSSEIDFDTEFFFYKGNAEGTDVSELILSDDDSGTGLQPYFEFLTPEEGYYFLRVAYFSNDPAKSKETDTGYYTLNIIENINLFTPNGGEVWQQGSSQVITWDPGFSGNIVLSLVYDSEKILDIATVSGADSTYSWTIPSEISSGVKYMIRIANEHNLASMDESNDYFAVAGTDSAAVAGTWNVHGTWGSKWDGIWTFSDNGTWSNSWGSSGTWELTGDIIKWSYESGVYYTGVVEGDLMKGVMNGGLGLYGTWEAQKQIK